MKRVYFLGVNEIALEVSSSLNKLKEGLCIIFSDSQQAEKSGTDGLSFISRAASANIKLHIIDSPDEIFKVKPDCETENVLFISIGAPWFFNTAITDRLKGKFFNLHGSRLPKDRGGNLFSWIILQQQRTGMCALHRMTAGIDDGPVVAYNEFLYPHACRLPVDYIQYYEARNVDFLCSLIQKWQLGEQVFSDMAQPEYLSSYWPRLRADVNGWVNWNWSVAEIDRFICAFDAPYGGARCRWRNKEVIIRSVSVQGGDQISHPFQSGLVFRNNQQWLSVAGIGGELLISTITDVAGTNLMDRIRTGDRLYSLPNDLAGTRQRIIKKKNGLGIQTDL